MPDDLPTTPRSAAAGRRPQRSPSWPENRRAPGRLELVRRLLNTTHLEDQVELIGSPDDVGRWLASEGFAAREPADERHATALVDFRERLRSSIDNPNVAPIDDTGWLFDADRRIVRFALVDDIPMLEGADDDAVDRYITTLTLIVAEALRDGIWDRFRTCANPDCRWAFYDNSKNGSGRWCSMDVCGARNKLMAYRSKSE